MKAFLKAAFLYYLAACAGTVTIIAISKWQVDPQAFSGQWGTVYNAVLVIIFAWLWPERGGRMLRNRLGNIQSHPVRLSVSALAVLVAIPVFSIQHIRSTEPPHIVLLDSPYTSMTGGTYPVRIGVQGANRVYANSGAVVADAPGVYTVFVPLKNPDNPLSVQAENANGTTAETFSISRAPTEEEKAEMKKLRDMAAAKREEELRQKREEEEKCMRNAKCRKEKEAQEKANAMMRRDTELQSWLDKSGSYEVWLACREAAERQLKSPSTAEFDNSSKHVWAAGGFVYVAGKVDAQNSFGAMLRSTFGCKIDVDLAGETMRVIDTNVN